MPPIDVVLADSGVPSRRILTGSFCSSVRPVCLWFAGIWRITEERTGLRQSIPDYAVAEGAADPAGYNRRND